MSKLTPKRQKFVDEYLVDLNATQAAIRAGYSKKTANPAAGRLLSNVSIQTAIQEGRQKLQARTEITQDRVVEELAAIAFFDPRELFDGDGNLIPVQDLPRNVAVALAGIETVTELNGTEVLHNKKYKFAQKIQALVQLGKHLGMFVDRAKVDVDLSDELGEILAAARKRVRAGKNGLEGLPAKG